MASRRPGWTIIHQTLIAGERCGRDIYVSNLQLKFYENLKKSKVHSLQKLFKSISSLNSQPGKGKKLNPLGNWRTLNNKDFTIEYFLDNGDVLIRKLHLIGEDPTNTSRNGVYQVSQIQRGGGVWMVNEAEGVSSVPNFKHRWETNTKTKIPTHYAAVAGKFENNSIAADQLINHIEKGYAKEISNAALAKPNNHYSLFWINPGDHGKAQTAQSMADMIHFTAKGDGAVSWLVHGEGAVTFQKGMNILSASANTQQLSDALSKQKVFFSNPTVRNPDSLEALCKKVGLHYEGLHNSKRNLKNAKTMSDAFKTMSKIAATATATGAVSAAAKTSGASALMTQARTTVDTVTEALSGAAGIGAGVAACVSLYFAGKSMYDTTKSSAQALKALGSTTFGKGNQYWFDTDDELFKQMKG